ncbi:hypothetical protein BDEG_26988 [Batrachochytrium dendrobatidis JEL423]|uniref:TLC domain-containing protein n=1 Tax=Batrachochytrium dendrobatidis (strain JEL423) TaxID=403673 RepID=A0A177WUS4_BATDL|nr:hypothetical protein BDEG_26988 [Batrachochytrium dendrobatidis JEL423]
MELVPHLESVVHFFLLFSSIHLAVSYLIAPLLIKKRILDSLSLDDRISVSEKVCSSVNSIITGWVGFWVLFLKPQFVGKQLFHSYPPILDTAFSMYLGYTLYDLITMSFQKHHWTMWLHHAMGALGTIVMLVYKTGAIYPCYLMITEFTAIINNALWYVKKIRDADVAENERLKTATMQERSQYLRPPPSLLYVRLMHIRAWGGRLAATIERMDSPAITSFRLWPTHVCNVHVFKFCLDACSIRKSFPGIKSLQRWSSQETKINDQIFKT